MNNGQGGEAPDLRAMQLLPPSGILSPDQYQRNMDQIHEAREALAAFERQNAAAYKRYVEQELWNRVQAGRQAEVQLAQLQAQQQAQSAISPKLVHDSSSHYASFPKRSSSSVMHNYVNAAPSYDSQMPLQHSHAYPGAPISDRPREAMRAPPPLPQGSHPTTQRPYIQANQQQRPLSSQSYPPGPSTSQQYRPGPSAPQPSPTALPPGSMYAQSPAYESHAYRPPYTTYQQAASMYHPSAGASVPLTTPSTTEEVPQLSQDVQSHASPAAPIIQQPQPSTSRANGSVNDLRPQNQGSTAVEPEIIRAKVTYSSQSAGPQPSPQKGTPEHKTLLESVARDVFGMMRTLKPENVSAVNRLVIEKLKDKLKPKESVPLRAILPENPQDAQAVSAIGTYVAEKVGVLEPADIILVLRHVQTHLLQRNAAKGAPNDVSGSNQQVRPASPEQIPSINGQSHSQIHIPESNASTSMLQSPSVVPPQPIAIPTIHPNGNVSAQAPAHQPQPLPFASASTATQSVPGGVKPPDTHTLARDILRALGRPARASSYDSQDDSRKRKRVSPTPVVDPTSEKKQKIQEATPGDAVRMVVDGATSSIPHSSQFAEGEIHEQLGQSASQDHVPAPLSNVDTTAPDLTAPNLGVAEPPTSPEPVEEIKTHGAMLTEAANEQEQFLGHMSDQIQQVNSVLQQLGVVPPVDLPSAATSPPDSQSSGASGSKDGHGAGTQVEVPASPAKSPTQNVDASVHVRPTTPQPENQDLSSPVAGPSKVPLFLPGTPTTEEGSPAKIPEPDLDGDIEMDDLVPTGLLGLPPRVPSKVDKGKQKAVEPIDSDETDDDITILSPSKAALRKWKARPSVQGMSDAEVVETSDVEEAKAIAHKGKPRRPQVYVLAPPLPADAVRLNERAQRQLSEEEGRRAVYLSRPRASEYHCPWHGCDAVLESAEKLGLHAQLHASENEEWNTFVCRWENCTEFYSYKQKLAEHLRRHSFQTLVCAYAGCQQTFTAPKDLARHHASYHRGDTLKPMNALITPELKDLPPMPQELPSYMSVPRHVSRARIPHDVHVWLGARVAANITCYVHPGSRAKATVPSRMTRRVADSIAAVEREAVASGVDPVQAVRRMARDEFDDWMEYNVKMPSFCNDLNSTEVTNMVYNGLVLHPQEEPIQPVAPANQKPPAPQNPVNEIPHHSEADAGGDVSQGGISEAPLPADSNWLGPLEIRSNAGTDEVAEMTRMLVDELPGEVEEMHGVEEPTPSGGGVVSHAADPNMHVGEVSESVPGWTTLRDDESTV